jgi:hypothetical protein
VHLVSRGLLFLQWQKNMLELIGMDIIFLCHRRSPPPKISQVRFGRVLQFVVYILESWVAGGGIWRPPLMVVPIGERRLSSLSTIKVKSDPWRPNICQRWLPRHHKTHVHLATYHDTVICQFGTYPISIPKLCLQPRNPTRLERTFGKNSCAIQKLCGVCGAFL